jgi:GINS complex subunit 1
VSDVETQASIDQQLAASYTSHLWSDRSDLGNSAVTVPFKMYGDEALQLILESRRSAQTSTLPKYNDPLIRQVALETRQLDHSIQSITASHSREQLQADQGLLCNLTVQHLSARRNKRCLMAYHLGRVEKVKEMYWEAGGGLAHLLASDMGSSSLDGPVEGNTNGTNNNPQHNNNNNPKSTTTTNMNGDNTLDLRSRLSPHELDFLRSYNDLILSYKTPYLDTLDLSSSISQPPKDLYVDVQVVKDCGVVFTENGQVEFLKGLRYMVRRNDVERLIVQGFLVEV